jgi:nucleotide-binding universal stress UspA family protein
MDYEYTGPGLEEAPRREIGLRRVAVVVSSPGERIALERASLLHVAPGARMIPVHLVEEPGEDGRRGISLVPASADLDPEDEEALFRPELIVIARGPRDLRSRLFGSTAERLVRAADHPVLVTQLPPRTAYSRALIATDFSPVAAEALRLALRMLQPGAAEAWVLHAYDTCYALVLRQVDAPPERLVAYLAQQREEAESRMAEFLEPHRVRGWNLQPICRPGDPVDAVKRSARSLRPELLVVGKHARSGPGRPRLGTVAEGSLRVAPSDVLVVPERGPTVH